MRVSSKKLVDCETPSGSCPIREWLDELDFIVSARVQVRINRVAHGNFGDAKSVGQGVSELRLTFGSGYRVYFAVHGDEIVVLLCGGNKSSQDDDIETAKKYWLDFKRRNNA
jgi:putative addiction module killer protein